MRPVLPRYITKAFFLFLLFGLLSSQGISQQAVVDSMFRQYEAETHDSIKAKLLSRITRKLMRINPDTALLLANQNIISSEKAGYDRLKGQALLDKAATLVRLGQYERAVENNLAAKTLFMELADSTLLPTAYQGLGIAYRHLGQYEAAMNAQLDGVKILEKTGGSRQPLARAYNNMAAVHGEIAQHQKAIEYFRKSLDIWREEKNPEIMAICYINIGGQAVELKDHDLAEENLSRGLQIFDSLGLQYGIGAAAANLGKLYMDLEKYAQAKTQIGIALESYRKLGDQGRIAMFLSDMGLVEENLKNYPSAIDYQKEALEVSQKVNRMSSIRDIQQRLARLYAKTGDYERAYAAHQEYIRMYDSLYSQNTANQIRELTAKYDAETKDKEIEFLEAEQEFQQKESRFLWSGLVLLLTLLGISLYAFFSSRTANKKLQVAQAISQDLLVEKEALIDQLKQTQLQLIQQEKMASLGQLSAGIAHEINNPVNFVNANARALHMDLNEVKPLLLMLSSMDDATDQAAFLEELITKVRKLDVPFLLSEIVDLSESIQRGSGRIQEIVSSLKSFSHSSGEGYQEADLEEILDATLTILTHKIKLKDIHVLKDYQNPASILCQPGKISQVAMNILDNAIDAVPQSGEIQIGTWQEESQVCIQISDNGIGINEQSKNRVFDPFFTTKDVGDGTGLGLSISYGIVKEHGGSISLETEEAKGARFLIRLPIKPPSL